VIPAQTIAYLCIVVGLSMIAGWWTAFRNRPYLGLLGASFLVLATYLIVRERVAANPAIVWVQIAALAIYAVLVVAAVVAAVQESRRRLAEVRENSRAAEEGFVAMMEAEQRRRAAKPEDDSSSRQSDKEGEQ
jgi:hypothetical protein